MNSTLNSLALLSFKRKARKIGQHLGKKIEVANLTNQGFFEEYLVRAGETLIIWGEENGFHSIFTKDDKELVYLVNFPDKYDYDEVYHFGILNSEQTKLYVYRCYDQYQSEGKTSVYGLQYQCWYCTSNNEFLSQQESERPFIEQGQGSRL